MGAVVSFWYQVGDAHLWICISLIEGEWLIGEKFVERMVRVEAGYMSAIKAEQRRKDWMLYHSSKINTWSIRGAEFAQHPRLTRRDENDRCV